MVPAIQARIQTGYGTDRTQLSRSLRDSDNEPPGKLSVYLVATILRSPLISGSGDSGSCSGRIRNWSISVFA